MKRLKIFLLALALMPMTVLAQSTREDLAKIRVGKDGNFKYWDKNSNAIDQLRKFVARVTDESSNDFVAKTEHAHPLGSVQSTHF